MWTSAAHGDKSLIRASCAKPLIPRRAGSPAILPKRHPEESWAETAVDSISCRSVRRGGLTYKNSRHTLGLILSVPLNVTLSIPLNVILSGVEGWRTLLGGYWILAFANMTIAAFCR
jgi:hypothetical protein